jgi:hypothetical protein
MLGLSPEKQQKLEGRTKLTKKYLNELGALGLK